jgi:hypothetical protein
MVLPLFEEPKRAWACAAPEPAFRSTEEKS